MGKRIEDWIGQYRHMDWAVLYMRLFAGGMMLFLNIGKMQDYNEIVNSYPSFASAGSAATFVVVTVAEVLLAVAKNPLIIASALGLLMQALHIVLPEVLVSFAGKMNSAATPLILLLLGASFEAQELATYKKELLVCVGLRLVVFPGLILTLSMALGLRDIEFVTLLAMTTAPTAVNSFNMAQQLGGDSHLAGSAVVVSTALSFFTLFFWITLFKQLGMF